MPVNLRHSSQRPLNSIAGFMLFKHSSSAGVDTELVCGRLVLGRIDLSVRGRPRPELSLDVLFAVFWVTE